MYIVFEKYKKKIFTVKEKQLYTVHQDNTAGCFD